MTVQSNKYVLNKIKSRSKNVFLGFIIIGLVSVIIMATLFDWEFFFGRNIYRHLFVIFALVTVINSIRQQILEDRRTIIKIEFNNDIFFSNISKDILSSADAVLTDTWESMGEKVDPKDLIELEKYRVTQTYAHIN